jgi:hypothetical protein
MEGIEGLLDLMEEKMWRVLHLAKELGVWKGDEGAGESVEKGRKKLAAVKEDEEMIDLTANRYGS